MSYGQFCLHCFEEIKHEFEDYYVHYETGLPDCSPRGSTYSAEPMFANVGPVRLDFGNHIARYDMISCLVCRSIVMGSNQSEHAEWHKKLEARDG